MTGKNLVSSNTRNAAHLMRIFTWVLLFIICTVVLSVLVVNFMGKETEKATIDFWISITSAFLVCALLLWTAKGLNQHRQWARYLGVLLSVISLIAFPVGTVLGLFILSYLYRGWHEQ